MEELEKKALEKLVDKAFEFANIIIKPPLEEIGGIFADRIRFWRYKNQVDILLKAKEYHLKKGISAKQIPVKTLVNLLESASYEEDEKLQEKWSALLANATNSSNKFALHNIFIDILKQLSPTEASVLDFMWGDNTSGSNQKYRREFNSSIMYYMLAEEGVGDIRSKYDSELEQIVLGNLIRLNLIEYSTPKIIDRNKRHLTGSEKKDYIIRDKQSIKLSELGFKFMNECSFNV